VLLLTLVIKLLLITIFPILKTRFCMCCCCMYTCAHVIVLNKKQKDK
jgi:hypothetical protein